MLDQTQVDRYSRQLPIVGIKGQEALLKARVLCVGAGGLGASALLYLAAAGVGHIGIVDADQVSLSNLQRQIIFTERDIGLSKAICAKHHLIARNNTLSVQAYDIFLNDENAQQLIEDYDIIIDCTDNFKARYLINDYCYFLKKPLISASIYQFQAQVSLFNYNNGPCYRCLYRTPPEESLIPNCALGGILGMVCGITGSLQASEAIKLITNKGGNLSGKLFTFDTLTLQKNIFPIAKSKDCPLCIDGKRSTHLFKSTKKETFMIAEITPKALNERLQSSESIHLIDVRESYEREIANIDSPSLHMSSQQFIPALLPCDVNDTIVLFCRSGVRSKACAFEMKEYGFTKVYNLTGGILAWIDEVDDTIRPY